MPKIECEAVWLRCSLDENCRRDKLRIPDHQMKERVDIVMKELVGHDWPEFVRIVDTTGMTSKQVLEAIAKYKNPSSLRELRF